MEREQEVLLTQERDAAIRYIREKVDQLLTVMGTLPLQANELDDRTLIELDPIGIVAESFRQVLQHLNETNNELEIAHSELQKILDSVGTAIVVVDPKLDILQYNRHSRETILNDIDAAQGRNLCELLKNSKNKISKKLLEKIVTGNSGSETAHIEIHGCHYHMVATPICNASGEVVRVIFSYSDISERIALEEKLRQAAVVFENASEGVIITDSKNRIMAVNRAFENLTGYREEEVLGQTPALLKSDRHDDAFYTELWQQLSSTGNWRGEIWDRRKDGTLIPLIEAISEVRRSDGSFSGYVSIFTDISLIKKSEEQLDYLAFHDPLTNLPNRLLLNDRLQHAIHKAKRQGNRLAVIFCDLDRFKNINDSLGHYVGDRLLCAAATRFQSALRGSDTVARLGGDEFIILLEDAGSSQDIARLCRNLIQLFQTPFDIDDHLLHIGLSLGVSIYPEDGTDVECLVKNADAAMYQAKEDGRNDFRFYTPELSSRAYERMNMEQALRRAIELDQLSLCYQPQLSLQQPGRITTEALLRWYHPELGNVPPDKFIPVLEETGLILPIGEWVLEQSFRQAALWAERYDSFHAVAINISGIQFRRGKLKQTIERLLRQYSLPASSIELEITENQLMHDVEETVTLLNELSDMGISLAIDDFGTGYSSLSYLKRFPVNKLKIDMSFVHDMLQDEDDAAIARAIIALGHSMGLAIVAEGIELAAQHRLLDALGCEYVQGFLYSHPLPADELEAYLAAPESMLSPQVLALSTRCS